jgi:hypothetical protein
MVGRAQADTNWSWRVTDRSGMADFGLVHPGEYTFQIYKGWDQGSLATSGEVHIEPGSRISKQIVCPKSPPDRARVRIRWEWPAGLDKEKLAIYAAFAIKPLKYAGLTWTLSDDRIPDPSEPEHFRRLLNNSGRWPATRSILCGPSASMAQVRSLKNFPIWALTGRPGEKFWMDLPASYLRELKGTAEAIEWDWEQGTYELSTFYVMRPSELASSKAVVKRFEIVVPCHVNPRIPNQYYQVLDSPPTYDDANGLLTKATRKNRGGGNGNGQRSLQYGALGRELSADAWSDVVRRFEARPGQVNDWKIPLPDELIKAVRDEFKDKK